MIDYNEILCEAIDTIVQQRLAAMKFDETIICTIIDDKRKEFGRYLVRYGSLTFEAYSDNTTYAINTQVYVLIPRGDYTQQKLILNKYIPE